MKSGTMKRCKQILTLVLVAAMMFGNLNLPGGIRISAEEPTSNILYEEDFDDVSMDDLKTKWNFRVASKITAGGFELQPDDSGSGQVLKLSREASNEAGLMEMHLWNGAFQQSKVVMLEYRIKHSGSGTFYIPSFCNWNPENTDYTGQYLVDLMLQDGALKYKDANATSWTDIMTDNTNITLAANDWHKIKLVVDTQQEKWFLYVDGVYCTITDPKARTADTYYTVSGKTVKDTSAIAPFYVDDIKITQEISSTEVAFAANTPDWITVGEPVQLSLKNTSTDTVIAGVTWKSSDESVATVDENGNVTGLTEGTVTITATPEQPWLTAMEKEITVALPVTEYTEDFDEVSEITDLEDWNFRGDENITAGGFKIQADDSGSGQILELSRGESEKACVTEMHLYDGVFQPNSAIMLEYRIKHSGTGLFYIPSFCNWNPDNTAFTGQRLVDLVLEAGALKYKDANATKWTGITTLTENEWHEIKLVVDTQQEKWFLYVDGVYCTVTNPKPYAAGTNYTVSGRTMKDTSAIAPFYVDDIKIAHVVSATAVAFAGDNPSQVNANESVQLSLEYTPANTTVTGASWTSSDESVATVDQNGMVTGVTEGTVTIKATPHQPWLNPVQTTITVAPAVVILPTVYAENFDDVSEMGQLTDWHYYGPKDGSGRFELVDDPSGREGKSMKLSREVGESGVVNFSLLQNVFQQTGKVVLEYSIYTAGDSGCYAPSLRGSDGRIVELILNGSYLQFRPANNGNDTEVASLTKNQWNSVKLIVDVQKNEWFLYVNGKDCTLANNQLSVQTEAWGVSVRTVQATGNIPGVWFDDFKLSHMVHAEDVQFADSVPNELIAGTPVKFDLVYTPTDATLQMASWSSSDESIATVDQSGNVTGWKEGEVTITADIYQDGIENVTKTVNVKVIQIENVEAEKDELTLPVGGHAFVGASVLPDNGSFQELVYTSSNEKIVTADEWGDFVAVGTGTAYVYVTTPEYVADMETMLSNQVITSTNTVDVVTVTVTEPDVIGTVYVAPDGTDNAVGTSADPVSLKGALDWIANNNDNMNGNLEVILADGYYKLSETLAITEAHGGTNNFSVVWKAAEGATPVIGSGYTIAGSDFEPLTTGSKIYVATVPDWLDSRQMFVNDVRAIRARSNGPLEGMVNSETGILCVNTELLDYERIQDLEMVYKAKWCQPRCGAASITDNGDGSVTLVMDQPGWFNCIHKGGTSSTPNYMVWYENALELLDEPGEWYLNTDDNLLYYMPRAFEDIKTATIKIPTIDGEMITITGSGYEDGQIANNIRFEGITFADTTWMQPSTELGHPDAQNNHYRLPGGNDTLCTAAVVVKAANGIHFENCTFTRLGINGVQMIQGVQNSTIIGNHFYDIAGNAVNIGEPDENSWTTNATGNQMMKNCDVNNNYIHDIGVDYGASAAISIGFAANTDSVHNEIFNIPNSGYHIGYGWERKFENILKNTVIEANFIHDLMGDGLWDGGAIYTLGNSSGDGYNYIRRNYVRNQMNYSAALYHDKGTTWWKTVENVVDVTETPIWERQRPANWLLPADGSNGETNIECTGNYTTTYWMWWGSGPQELEEVINGTIVVKDNILFDPAEVPEAAQTIIAESGLESEYAYLYNSQAERIRHNLPEEGITLQNDKNYQVTFSFTDGKDQPVDGGNLIQSYEILDTTVATVDENGLITYVGNGITALRVTIVSNNIADVYTCTIYAGDTPVEMVMTGIDDTITMSTASSGKAIAPQVITAFGRELTPEVTCTVADETIAKMENGVLKPVGLGNTTVTVKAIVDGGEISKTYAVKVVEKVEGYPDNLWELFNADYRSGWFNTGTKTWEWTPDTSLQTHIKGYATFIGETYHNELMTFRMKIDTSTGGGGWPSFVFRVNTADDYLSSAGTTGYIICFGMNGTNPTIDLYRFNNGVRSLVAGAYDDTNMTPLSGLANVNNPLADGKLHLIEVGAIADGDDARVILKIDGVSIVDYLDKAADGAITTPGYTGIIGRGNETFTLEKVTSIADDKKATVTVNALDDNQNPVAAVITGTGKYDMGAEVTVKANDLAGYVFQGWYSGEQLKSEDSSYTFILEENVTLIAKYKVVGGETPTPTPDAGETPTPTPDASATPEPTPGVSPEASATPAPTPGAAEDSTDDTQNDVTDEDDDTDAAEDTADTANVASTTEASGTSTGDNSNLILWMMLLLATVAGLALVWVIYEKKKFK